MRVCYILLSPTFGMHQYTADLVNRMADAGHDVHLVTTTCAPRDRYASSVTIHSPVRLTTASLSREVFHFAALRRLLRTIGELSPDVVHFTGPHPWNVLLILDLVRQHIPVVHTLHDLDPHRGFFYDLSLRVWNRLISYLADHILVHGQTYRQHLLRLGVPASRVSWTPLLHLFVGGTRLEADADLAALVKYEPWALFFGRIARHKGIDCLLTACAMMDEDSLLATRLVVAGTGEIADMWADPVPQWMELRSHLIEDEEAIDLFQRCGLLVLPYVDATQSALIAAAYYFHKPVVVTHAGALPEYVEEGVTGVVLEPGHPAALARCLEELLDDPERLARMGAAGRAWYETQRAIEERSLFKMYGRLGHDDQMPEPTVKLSDRPI